LGFEGEDQFPQVFRFFSTLIGKRQAGQGGKQKTKTSRKKKRGKDFWKKQTHSRHFQRSTSAQEAKNIDFVKRKTAVVILEREDPLFFLFCFTQIVILIGC
jgi:hypothetical protein